MRAHDLDTLQKTVRRAAVDHLLDDQRADHASGHRLGILGELCFFVTRFEQRQNGDRLRVRFIDIRIERFFDLRCEVRGVAGEPYVLARFYDRGCQVA